MTAHADFGISGDTPGINGINLPKFIAGALAYGAVFFLLFKLADMMFGLAGFSLWYPAAGLRFALIFALGWRFGFVAAFMEVLAQGVAGEWANWFWQPHYILLGVTGPVFLYSGIVWALDHFKLSSLKFEKLSHVLWFLTAACLTPLIAAPMSTGIQILGGRMPAEVFGPATFSFWVGDMVGILMLAPLAMLVITIKTSQSLLRPLASLKFAAELFAALSFAAIIFAWSPNLLPTFAWAPLVAPILWISFRHGFGGAALIIFSVNVMALGVGIGDMSPDARFELQLYLSILSVMGLLIGGQTTSARSARALIREDLATLAHQDRLNTMGEMTAQILHELVQPAGATTFYAKEGARILSEGEVNMERLNQAMTRVAELSDRSTEIIERMRTFAMKGTMKREECDANEIVDGIKDMIEIAAKPAGVTVVYELAEEPLPLFVDIVQIQQCLLNLVRNGIEAMEGQQERVLKIYTTISASREIRLAVSDIGPGFPDHFETGMSTKDTGMGLGLKVVCAIITEHNGQIHLSANLAEIALPNV